MFIDLVKAKKGGASKSEREDELSPERIRELMDELFSGGDDGSDDEMDKGGRYSAKMYKMNEDEGDDDEMMDEMMDDEDEDEGEDDERREMMDKVYSMIDDLSDEELKRIIDSRTMRKALAMNIVSQMSNQALSEFVSQIEANGEQGMSELEKGGDDGDLEDLDMMDDEDDLEKGRGESCDF